MSVRDAMRWFQAHLGFINDLPSWLNELLSGFLCVGMAALVMLAVELLALLLFGLRFHHAVWAFPAVLVWLFPLSFVLSELYENLADPWGYNPQDVVERMRGIVLVMLAVTIRGML